MSFPLLAARTRFRSLFPDTTPGFMIKIMNSVSAPLSKFPRSKATLWVWILAVIQKAAQLS
jgi:hypothetical protein